jgi:tRNA A37 threonylcarbamoyladenosine modification protein TsaB
LILAFDTATDIATIAFVRDGDVLGERVSRAVKILDDADALIAEAGAEPSDVDGLAVGTGPGS